MERFTVSLEADLAQQFEKFMVQRGYTNRSEAVRDLMRERLQQEQLQTVVETSAYCVGSLTYVYNHHERELSSRVTQAHHDHHDLVVAMQHVHLDHDNCLETVIVKGNALMVQAFADSVVSAAGVRYGKLHIIPVETQTALHSHGNAPYARHFRHTHLRPIN